MLKGGEQPAYQASWMLNEYTEINSDFSLQLLLFKMWVCGSGCVCSKYQESLHLTLRSKMVAPVQLWPLSLRLGASLLFPYSCTSGPASSLHLLYPDYTTP